MRMTMLATRPSKPVNAPRRALFFNMGLLAALLVSAFATTRGDHGQKLGDAISLADWGVTFAPPANWIDHGERPDVEGGRIRLFSSPNNRSTLAVGRLTVPADLTSAQFCRDLSGAAEHLRAMGARGASHFADAKFGDWPAVELDWTPTIMEHPIVDHVYLLAAVQGEAEPNGPFGYFVRMETTPPLRPRDTKVWQMIVDAIHTPSESQ